MTFSTACGWRAWVCFSLPSRGAATTIIPSLWSVTVVSEPRLSNVCIITQSGCRQETSGGGRHLHTSHRAGLKPLDQGQTGGAQEEEDTDQHEAYQVVPGHVHQVANKGGAKQRRGSNTEVDSTEGSRHRENW